MPAGSLGCILACLVILDAVTCAVATICVAQSQDRTMAGTACHSLPGETPHLWDASKLQWACTKLSSSKLRLGPEECVGFAYGPAPLILLDTSARVKFGSISDLEDHGEVLCDGTLADDLPCTDHSGSFTGTLFGSTANNEVVAGSGNVKNIRVLRWKCTCNNCVLSSGTYSCSCGANSNMVQYYKFAAAYCDGDNSDNSLSSLTDAQKEATIEKMQNIFLEHSQERSEDITSTAATGAGLSSGGEELGEIAVRGAPRLGERAGIGGEFTLSSTCEALSFNQLEQLIKQGGFSDFAGYMNSRLATYITASADRTCSVDSMSARFTWDVNTEKDGRHLYTHGVPPSASEIEAYGADEGDQSNIAFVTMQFQDSTGSTAEGDTTDSSTADDFTQKGTGGCCRSSTSDSGTSGVDYYLVSGVISRWKCKLKCVADAECKAVDWLSPAGGDAAGTCALWTKMPHYASGSGSNECLLRKRPSCSSQERPGKGQYCRGRGAMQVALCKDGTVHGITSTANSDWSSLDNAKHWLCGGKLSWVIVDSIYRDAVAFARFQLAAARQDTTDTNCDNDANWDGANCLNSMFASTPAAQCHLVKLRKLSVTSAESPRTHTLVENVQDFFLFKTDGNEAIGIKDASKVYQLNKCADGNTNADDCTFKICNDKLELTFQTHYAKTNNLGWSDKWGRQAWWGGLDVEVTFEGVGNSFLLENHHLKPGGGSCDNNFVFSFDWTDSIDSDATLAARTSSPDSGACRL